MDARDVITKNMTVGDLKKKMNYGSFKSKDGTVKVIIVGNEYDEYVGKWYDNGKYNESKTNYTDDKSDAIATAKTTIKHYDKYKK